jgi:hypothetical protein
MVLGGSLRECRHEARVMNAKAVINIVSDDLRLDLHLDGRQREMLEAVRRLADALIADDEEAQEEPDHG